MHHHINRSGRVLIVLVAFFGHATAEAQQQPREILQAASIEPHVGQRLPLSAEFLDHSSHTVRLGDIVGKRPMVLCLVYFECPMLCKLAADGLVRSVASMHENVGEGFDVVFISFDPRDTPQRAAAARDHALKQYARESTAAGWYFLTGEQTNIEQVTETVGFRYRWDDDTKQFSHATGIMLVTPEGIISEYLDGVNFSPNELSAAIDRAGMNELTESTSNLFMRCFLYDPTTGKLGIAVQWTIRGLGIATVLGIVILVVRLGRHDIKQEIGTDQP